MNFEINEVLEKKEILVNQHFENGLNYFNSLDLKNAIKKFEEVIMFDDRNEKAYYYLALCYSRHFLFGEEDEIKIYDYLEKRAKIVGYYDFNYFKFIIDTEKQKILDYRIDNQYKILCLLEEIFINKLNEFCLKFDFQYHKRDIDYKLVELNCETIFKVSKYISLIINDFIVEKKIDTPYIEKMFEDKMDDILDLCKYELSFCYINYADNYFYMENNYTESIFWIEKAISLYSYNRFYRNLAISYTKIGNRMKAIENYIIESSRIRSEDLFIGIVEKFGTENLINDIINQIKNYSITSIWKVTDWIFRDCIELHKKNFNFAKEDIINMYSLYSDYHNQLGKSLRIENYNEFKKLTDAN